MSYAKIVGLVVDDPKMAESNSKIGKTILLDVGFIRPANVLIFFVILSAPAFHLK